jgi:two-component system nitrogen regulation sensor histidine kinase GlnL
MDAARLLDQLSTGILITDAALRVITVNNAAEAMLNISQHRAIGVPLIDLSPGTARLERTARRALEGQRPFTERALRFANEKLVDVSYGPFLSEEEWQLMIELLPVQRHRDMADAETLERQQAALTELLRGLAHEVKNPLGGLRGAAQLLERELDHEELREYTRVIIAEADRLAMLVDRFQKPLAPHRPGLVNVHEALEHVRRLMQAGHEEIRVRRDYDPSIPDIRGDRDRLVQVMLNLTKNAIEAGAQEILLRTRLQRQVPIGSLTHRAVVAMDVCDNGPGVPTDLSELLFYPLVSGNPSGTGLGLAIAQRIAKEHGGVIRFRSSPGDTTFSCLLPLKTDEEART